MNEPTLNAYLTRKTDDAVADDDDGLMHLSYADDYLALLNACVIDCLHLQEKKRTNGSMSENGVKSADFSFLKCTFGLGSSNSPKEKQDWMVDLPLMWICLWW